MNKPTTNVHAQIGYRHYLFCDRALVWKAMSIWRKCRSQEDFEDQLKMEDIQFEIINPEHYWKQTYGR